VCRNHCFVYEIWKFVKYSLPLSLLNFPNNDIDTGCHDKNFDNHRDITKLGL